VRKPLIAANWKMNTTPSEAVALVQQLLPGLMAVPSVETLLCPPFISLVLISELLRGSDIELGAQNVYFEDKGAFTGEISLSMLTGYCKYVILGHSERRSLFGETNQTVNKKIRAAISAGLRPILCIGESLEEKEAGLTESVVTTHLQQSLEGITDTSMLVVAYEPVWAIGTGHAATGEQAEYTVKLIRNVLASIFDADTASAIRILYGGSANAANISEFISQPNIDGALVGGASLKPAEFIDMVEQTAKFRPRTLMSDPL